MSVWSFQVGYYHSTPIAWVLDPARQKQWFFSCFYSWESVTSHLIAYLSSFLPSLPLHTQTHTHFQAGTHPMVSLLLVYFPTPSVGYGRGYLCMFIFHPRWPWARPCDTLLLLPCAVFCCGTLRKTNVFSSVLWQFCSLMLGSSFLPGGTTAVWYPTVFRGLFAFGVTRVGRSIPLAYHWSDGWVTNSSRCPSLSNKYCWCRVACNLSPTPFFILFEFVKALSPHVFVTWW